MKNHREAGGTRLETILMDSSLKVAVLDIISPQDVLRCGFTKTNRLPARPSENRTCFVQTRIEHDGIVQSYSLKIKTVFW